METSSHTDASTTEFTPESGVPSQPSTSISFNVPAGACDCLTHIYGDPAIFPMAPERTYTPELASLPEIRSLHKALHVDRVIIVQPTIYGTDNACTVDAVRQLGSRARGVAVVAENISAADLDAMHKNGIRGVRINLETVGLTDPAIARRRLHIAIEQVRHRLDWHIQIYMRPRIIEAIYDLLVECPVPIVFDHFGGIKVATGMQEPGVGLLLELLHSGRAYVKLSAPYLASQHAPNFYDVIPLANILVATNAERILWGTNWPHPNSGRVEGRRNTDIAPLREVDDGHILNLLPHWVSDESIRKAVLVDNPARLYGF